MFESILEKLTSNDLKMHSLSRLFSKFLGVGIWTLLGSLHSGGVFINFDIPHCHLQMLAGMFVIMMSYDLFNTFLLHLVITQIQNK